MRRHFALLLLLATVLHPIAHVDEALVCAAAHGALIDAGPLALVALSPRAETHTIVPQTYVPVVHADELPARAPPVA